jgi:hypothetical protein
MTTVSYELSAYQREQLEQLHQQLPVLLTQRANELARETGFVQRQSPITGAAFAQTLVFGFLNEPGASYSDLQQMMGLQGVQVSNQAIEQRMSPQAANFLQRLLESLVALAVAGEPTKLPLFERFNGVYLQDGSVISLCDELAAAWPGCGSWSEHGGQAGVRVQMRLEMTDGHVVGPWLQPARESEKSGVATAQETPLPKGALYITDAGLQTLSSLRALDEQGVFWLTAASLRQKIIDQHGKVWDLPSFLLSHPKAPIDEPIRAGLREQVPCRLIAVPLPQKGKSRKPCGLAASRKGSRHDVQVGRKKQPKKKVRKIKKSGARRRVVEDWLILLTNVPPELLSVPEARELMRLRWQIELIWKLWKQCGQIDVWRSEKPARILCEVFAKLMGMVIQHWLSIVGSWQDLHRSLVKAGRLVKKVAPALVLTLQGPLTLQGVLQRCCEGMRRCRLNPRRKHPNTSQHLLALSG